MPNETLKPSAEQLQAEMARIEEGKEKINQRFWRASTFTAASVLTFVASIITIDMGVNLGGSYIMEVIAATSAVSGISGAAFAQSASGKLDKFDEQASEIRSKITELTSKREIGMTKEQELAGQKARMAEREKSKDAQKRVGDARGKVELEGPSSGRSK
ncbi:MAG: hypothetical protein LW825_03325 [Candidatus Jidaibacter sp.]|jgi:hypothetical protein|nr:hypothetical protein [Candidatus Jidaibacter sp.]